MWFYLTQEQLEGQQCGSDALCTGFYGEDGKPYPRLVLAVYRPAPGAIEVTCSVKSCPSSSWAERGIPDEVVPDLSKMLAAYANKTPLFHPQPDTTEEEVRKSFGDWFFQTAQKFRDASGCSMRYAVRSISEQQTAWKDFENERARRNDSWQDLEDELYEVRE